MENMKAGDKCPYGKCGGRLLTKVNSRTKQKFLGCSNFPACKYTENIFEISGKWVSSLDYTNRTKITNKF